MAIGLQFTDEESGELMPSGGRDTSLVLQDLSLSPKPHDHIDGWRDITNWYSEFCASSFEVTKELIWAPRCSPVTLTLEKHR